MSNDSDRCSLVKSPAGRPSGSYTYGRNCEYRVSGSAGSLPPNFWRESVATKGFSDIFLPNQQEDYSDEKIKIQNVIIAKSVARYNKWLVVVGFAAACISIFQWTELRNQIKEMQFEQRPWIRIDTTSPLSPFHIDGLGAHLNIEFALQNTGHMPARHVMIVGVPFVCTCKLGDIEQALQGTCAIARQRYPITGKTIFPEQDYKLRYNFDFNVENVNIYNKIVESTAGRAGAFMIAGCVDYLLNSDRGGDHHQTTFVREVDKTFNRVLLRITPAEGDVPLDQVALAVNPLITEDAD